MSIDLDKYRKQLEMTSGLSETYAEEFKKEGTLFYDIAFGFSKPISHYIDLPGELLNELLGWADVLNNIDDLYIDDLEYYNSNHLLSEVERVQYCLYKLKEITSNTGCKRGLL